jgi:hypothetical protein
MSEPKRVEELMAEICGLCGGKPMPHCDPEVQNICLRDYIKRHPQLRVVATVLAPVNPAGQAALARHNEIIERLQVPPEKRVRSKRIGANGP